MELDYEMFERRARSLGLYPAFEKVAAKYAVTVEEVYSSSRRASVMLARAETWAMLRERYYKSCPEIALLFGRDPTTILHALRRRKNRQDNQEKQR